LLRDPGGAEWSALSRFNETLTREAFEQRLREVFDPFHGLDAFLQITNNSVKVFAAPGREQLAEVRRSLEPFLRLLVAQQPNLWPAFGW
jgi:hypothetical protein